MDLPKRKKTRLEGYDYSSNGAYFVTICTHNREILFGNVGADSISARMVENVWHKIINQYENIQCPHHVIMPNHFHAIIVVER
ncbi:MAG: transposase, partial [Raoultibacter sp.]